jgi:hypothetical protein
MARRLDPCTLLDGFLVFSVLLRNFAGFLGTLQVSLLAGAFRFTCSVD